MDVDVALAHPADRPPVYGVSTLPSSGHCSSPILFRSRETGHNQTLHMGGSNVDTVVEWFLSSPCGSTCDLTRPIWAFPVLWPPPYFRFRPGQRRQSYPSYHSGVKCACAMACLAILGCPSPQIFSSWLGQAAMWQPAGLST